MTPPISGPFENDWSIRVVPGQVDPSCQPSNDGFQWNFAYRVVLARKDPGSNIRPVWLIIYEIWGQVILKLTSKWPDLIFQKLSITES